MKHTPAPPKAPPAVNAATVRLWAFAARVLARLVDWFGSPEAIVAERVVNRRWVWDMKPWLGPLEALVRRLLMADALAAPASIVVLRSAKEPRAAVAATARSPLSGARLCFPGMAQVAPRAMTPPSLPPMSALARLSAQTHFLVSEPKTIPVAPYARRLAALVAVIAAPARHARRLARRLAATPGRWRRFRRPPTPRRLPMREDFVAALRRAHAHATCAPDTG